MCENCERMGIPASLGEQIAAMQQQAMMRMTDKKAAVVDFLTRQSREDLVTIIEIIDAAKNSKTTSGLFMGLAKGILIQKYDTNFDGQTMEEAMAAEEMVRHAENLRDSGHVGLHVDLTPRDTSNDPNWEMPKGTHNPQTGEPLPDAELDNQLPLFEVEKRADGYPIEDLTLDEIHQAMEKYNLRSSEVLGRYICIKCGLEYVSIADRALRDDCHGCLARASQG